jgi:hypothetical protein
MGRIGKDCCVGAWAKVGAEIRALIFTITIAGCAGSSINDKLTFADEADLTSRLKQLAGWFKFNFAESCTKLEVEPVLSLQSEKNTFCFSGSAILISAFLDGTDIEIKIAGVESLGSLLFASTLKATANKA